jgi:hypothetical protein
MSLLRISRHYIDRILKSLILLIRKDPKDIWYEHIVYLFCRVTLILKFIDAMPSVPSKCLWP